MSMVANVLGAESINHGQNTTENTRKMDQKTIVNYQPACVNCVRSRMKNATTIKKHGITLDEYEAMHDAQDSVCAICGQPETKTDPRRGKTFDLAIDHDHETGKVRALLCHGCNTALGLLKEDINLIDKLKAYIMEHNNV